MANNQNYRILASGFIFVFAVLLQTPRHECVDGKNLGSKHKGTVKTIKSDDGTDVIDCVDFYQQSAFDDPLIKPIKMNLSSYLRGMEVDDSSPKLVQDWHKNGECPIGTIPIRRSTTHDNLHRTFLRYRSYGIRADDNATQNSSSGATLEFASVTAFEGAGYYGTKVTIDVWNPIIEKNANEFSTSQIWILSDAFGPETLNTVEAGWIVYPNLYGDNKTRLFGRWTRDGHNNTGCYDLRCSGFVQIDRRIALGMEMGPISIYNDTIYAINIEIYKDISSGWWLAVEGERIGYWPNSIFTRFDKGAEVIQWGGEIINSKLNGHHTSTQMGSGHFPTEGYFKTSHFRDVQVQYLNQTFGYPTITFFSVSNPKCYDISILGDGYFSYGGPGFSEKCQ